MDSFCECGNISWDENQYLDNKPTIHLGGEVFRPVELKAFG